MYMNEKLVPMAMILSKKITLATRYKMKEEKYASENFQVMNYGMGGLISVHADCGTNPHSEGEWHDSEHVNFGYTRYMTFMLYLSDVVAGGHTVFPQIGVSVKPVHGAALYWINHGPDMTFDSRVLHAGCPVIYGNKWIANKWIKFLAQFRFYPCTTHKKHFSVLGNV